MIPILFRSMKTIMQHLHVGSEHVRLLNEPVTRRPLLEKKISAVTVSFFLLLVAALGFVAWFDISIFSDHFRSSRSKLITEFPLKCNKSAHPAKQTCPSNYYPTKTAHNPDRSSKVTCPSYFRWFHEDLRPWAETGITREMIEGAKRTAFFRLVMVNGKVYIENYKSKIQGRGLYTLWGILQLLRLYPGRLPDFELMFNCKDRPVLIEKYFRSSKSFKPPLFRYSSDDRSLDIVFPDWTFWGWPETHIRPWEKVLEDIKEGNKRSKWKDRIPYAYWQGNPGVALTRKDLMKCNVSDKNDWNTRLYIQDWDRKNEQGLIPLVLEINANTGWAWSTSEKYILACDAMTLYVNPRYYDFFSRGMSPLQHYWPIRDDTKCTSLKFAVEWGNNNTDKAEAIGKAGSRFIQEDLKMENVYDYMFHLLNEYAKLLRFKPTVPKQAIEVCLETPAWDALSNKFMEESLVMSPSHKTPCQLPVPYERQALVQLREEKTKAFRQVIKWENEYLGTNLNRRKSNKV